MSHTSNLAFDAVDTDSLVEAYSQRHNRNFKTIADSCYAEDGYHLDACDNKIFISKFSFKNYDGKTLNEADRSVVLKKIAQKIKANADLFAQMEAKTRRLAADKVKSTDIELIVKEFEHYSKLALRPNIQAKQSPQSRVVVEGFYFTEDTPLCALALYARHICQSDVIYVVSRHVNCSLVTYLFVELCLEAGYPPVLIEWIYRPTEPSLLPSLIAMNGSTAVVTHTADIDSAVDCLVDASQDYRYPWRLRRILVQESVFDRFRRALARSAAPSATPSAAPSAAPSATPSAAPSATPSAAPHPLSGQSAACYSRGDKHFLVDFTGSPADVKHRQSLVLVEAYRTTKELLSLLHKYQPSYLSLWSSDVSVSNEIALSVQCSVWVNNLAWVQGPHLKSHSVGMVDDSVRLLSTYPLDGGPKEEIEQLKTLRTKWVKTNIETRRETILEVLGRSPAWNDVVQSLVAWEPQTFVSVENGNLCQGFQEPWGLVVFYFPPIDSDDNSNKYVLQVLQSAIIGNGLLMNNVSYEPVRILMKDIRESNVPVIISDGLDFLNLESLGISRAYNVPLDAVARGLSRTRVISYHFGETFAN